MSLPTHTPDQAANPRNARDAALLPTVGVAGLLLTPSALLGAAILFTLAMFSPAASTEFQSPGHKVFVKSKCVQCHTVSALKIAKVESDEEEEEEDDAEKRDPPDLSGVGKEYSDAQWLAKYLKKQERIENRRHKKKWSGSEADLTTLTEWLVTLKHDVPKGGKK
jgi:hypothetical protein